VFRASRIARISAFVALAVSLGFLLAPVPNVELVTLAVFLGGAVSRPAGGAAIGALAAALHSGLNPLGLPLPLVLVAQIVGLTLVGLVGGSAGRRLPARHGAVSAPRLVAVGAGLTAIYQLLVNLALGVHLDAVGPTLLLGLPFAGLHLASNMLVFGLLGSQGLRVLDDLGELGPVGEVG
jgi:hypothetical protein